MHGTAWRSRCRIRVVRRCVDDRRIHPVVERDGLDRVGEGCHHSRDGVGDRTFSVALHATAFHEARSTFHRDEDRTAMISTDDCVAFPVTKGLTTLDSTGRWSISTRSGIR